MNIYSFTSYLQNRNFIVAADRAASTERKIVAGFPQGSILGSVHFLYFINEVPKSEQVKLLSLFEDYTVLYTSSWRFILTVEKLQTYLNILLEYFRLWKIKVNVEKTEYVIFKHE